MKPNKYRHHNDEGNVESQKRRYEGDWVTVFVQGDGKDFDWGCDHLERGIVKFLHQQSADE